MVKTTATIKSKPNFFHVFARKVAAIVGSPRAFGGAVLCVLIWSLSGPYFGFSDTWQLVINTGTTIVTFLVVFLIQNSQNRDAQAVHLKLDELIRAIKGARNELINLENMSDEELEIMQKEFKDMCEKVTHHLNRRQ